MDQLRQSYGGDRSESLAQILSAQYQPQQAMSAMDQQLISSGISASTALKTKQMELDKANNRDFQTRQSQIYDERRKALQGQIMLKNIMEGKRAAISAYFNHIAEMYDERDPFQAREKELVLSGLGRLETILSGKPEAAAAALETADKLGFTKPERSAGGASLTKKADEVEDKKKSDAKKNAPKEPDLHSEIGAAIDMWSDLEKELTPDYSPSQNAEPISI